MLEIHQRTIEQFKDRVLSAMSGRIGSIVVYGSAARNHDTHDSDIDLLIVGDEGSVMEAARGIAYDVDLENGTATSIVYMTRGELQRHVDEGSPLIENIVEEGIVIYDDGTYSNIRDKILPLIR